MIKQKHLKAWMTKSILILAIILLIGCNKEQTEDNQDTADTSVDNVEEQDSHQNNTENSASDDPEINPEDDRSIENFRFPLMKESQYKSIEISSENTQMIDEIGFDPRRSHTQRIYPEVGADFLSENEGYFDNIVLPEGAQVKYIDVAKDSGISWGYSSYICDYALVVLADDRMFFSFGTEEADQTFEFQVDGDVIDTCLSMDKKILIVYKNSQQYYLKIYSPYGDVLYDAPYDVEVISKVYLYPKNLTDYYLFFQLEDEYIIQTYRLENSVPDSETDLPESTEGIKNVRLDEEVLDVKVNHITRAGNMIAIDYERQDYAGEAYEVQGSENMPRRYVMCMDYDLVPKYVYQIPKDWKLEHLYNISDLRYSLYFSQGKQLYQYDQSINPDRLSVIVGSEDSWDAIINGMTYEAEYAGGNIQPYSFWKTKDYILMYSNNGEIGKVFCEDADIIEKTDEILLAGGYHIGVSETGTVIFVTPEGMAYDPEYKSAVYEQLMGKHFLHQGAITSYEGGIVFIDEETNSIVYMTDDGGCIQKASFDEETVEELINNNNGLFYDMKDFEEALVIELYKKLIIYNKVTEQINTLSLPDYVNYDGALRTYRYGEHYYFDFDKLTFVKRFLFKKEAYNNFVYDGVYYDQVYGYYEGKRDYLRLVEGDFIEIYLKNDSDTIYRVVDSRAMVVNNEPLEFVKDYDGHYIYQTDTESYMKPIIREAVREYEVSEHGIVYNGYDEHAYAYFYSFDSRESQILNTEEYALHVAITQQHLIAGFEDTIKTYTVNHIVDTNSEQTLNIRDFTNDPGDIDYKIKGIQIAGRECLALFFPGDERGILFDLKDLSVVREIRTEQMFLAEEDSLYYKFGPYGLSLDLVDNRIRLFSNVSFPSILEIVDEDLLVYYGYDGPGDYTFINKETDLLEDIEDDYVLFVYQDDYVESLYLLDRKAAKLEILCDSLDGDIEYNVSDSGIDYRYDGSIDGESVSKPWTTYPLIKGASVYVID